MTVQSLRIFHKKKGIYVYPYQWFGIFLTVILLFVAILDYQGVFDLSDWFFRIGIVWLLYWIGFELYNYFRYQKEIGEYIGEITFWKDKIQVGKLEFNLEEISKLDFIKASDIQGRYIWNDSYALGPQKSNGLDNRFILKLKNGEVVSDNFLQTEWRRLKLYKEVLIHYYQVGILEWLQLVDILGIKDYQKIQQFKIEVLNYTQQRL